MKTFSRLLLLTSVPALLAGFVFAQDKPGDSPAKCCTQDDSPRTVVVNGVAEPVYRSGTRGLANPRPTYMPAPEYSDKGRKKKIQGVVTLSVVVTSAGNTADIQVLKSLGCGLDEKAVEAVQRWKFQPATKDGKPVAVYLNVDVSFKLY